MRIEPVPVVNNISVWLHREVQKEREWGAKGQINKPPQIARPVFNRAYAYVIL